MGLEDEPAPTEQAELRISRQASAKGKPAEPVLASEQQSVASHQQVERQLIDRLSDCLAETYMRLSHRNRAPLCVEEQGESTTMALINLSRSWR